MKLFNLKPKYIMAILLLVTVTIMLSFYYKSIKLGDYISYFQGLHFVIQILIVLGLLFIQTFVVNLPTMTITAILIPKLFPNLYMAIFVNVFTQIIAAIAIFFIFTYFLKGMFDIKRFKKLKDLNERYGKLGIFMARVVPILGYDIVNVGSAILGINKKDFIVGTILGLVVVVPIYTYLGWIIWY